MLNKLFTIMFIFFYVSSAFANKYRYEDDIACKGLTEEQCYPGEAHISFKDVSIEPCPTHSKGELYNGFSSMWFAISVAYDEYLKSNKNSKTEGTIVIKFTIKTDGSVVNDTVLSSTTGDKKFDKIIREKVRSSSVFENISIGRAPLKKFNEMKNDTCLWLFRDGIKTTLTVPFKFQKRQNKNKGKK